LHAKRVTAGLRNRIPGPIWVGLFVLAVLSLGAMGYHTGLTSSIRPLAVLAVALAFSAVIALIADLDRPQEGLLTVSQQALIDVRSMNEPVTATVRPIYSAGVRPLAATDSKGTVTGARWPRSQPDSASM
jgi:hypothetical protein